MTNGNRAENLMHQHFKAWAFEVYDSHPVQIYVTRGNVGFVEKLMKDNDIQAVVHQKTEVQS